MERVAENMKSVQQSEESITLINGTFNPGDARDLLLGFVNNKISFHEMRNFSLEERTGCRDEASDKRVLELKQSRESIAQLVEKAKAEGRKIKVESQMVLTLI
jgi:hypothetical protein